jgi:hypothetical protein
MRAISNRIFFMASCSLPWRGSAVILSKTSDENRHPDGGRRMRSGCWRDTWKDIGGGRGRQAMEGSDARVVRGTCNRIFCPPAVVCRCSDPEGDGRHIEGMRVKV